MTPSFSFTGPPLYFDGLANGGLSLSVVTAEIIGALRDTYCVPAFALDYEKASIDFHHGRHLLGSPPALEDVTRIPEYIYVDSGLAKHQKLGLYAKQSVVLTAVDDFRWKFSATKHAWKSVDTILAFSEHSAKVLSAELKRSVGYMPLGVNTKTFFPINPQPKPPPIKQTVWKNFTVLPKAYTFLTVGFMQDRKGIKDLLAAYYKAFYGQANVLLWIHGRSGNWAEDRPWDELKTYSQQALAPMLIWTDGNLTAAELNQLYNSADCYVCTSHLEGFGLGPLQAMACSKPVISTDFSGLSEYITKDNAHIIPSKAGSIKHPRLGRVPWAKYNIDDLVSLLRQFPGLRGQERQTAVAMSWSRTAHHLLKAIPQTGSILAAELPGVTICIPCHSNAEDLDKCLTSMIPWKSPSVKVLVGNDGCSLAVSTICHKHQVEEVLIRHSEGVNKVRNLLVSKVKTEHTVFLDCDTIITDPMWLQLWLAEHIKYKAAASTILQLNPDGTVNSAGHNVIGWPSICQNTLPRTEVYQPRQILYTQTSAAMFNTELLHKFPFWEEYKLYYDEADLCTYLRRHGHTCWYLPVTSLIHTGGSYK